MLLSEILSKDSCDSEYEIINELDFKYLGLVESTIEQEYCTFIDSPSFINNLLPNVKMLITTRGIYSQIYNKNLGFCITDNPRKLFFDIHNLLSNDKSYIRPKFKTVIGKNCRISTLASVADYNVIIEDNVIIEEFVVIRENTVIKENTILRAGCVIGGEGYEFKRTQTDIAPVKHLGGVILGKNSEIQYNSCVDKAVYPWDNTIIGDYNKIDNLVHIAHAVKTENNVMFVALSGIGGRTEIKSNTWIGFGSIIRNGIIIGENSRANIGAIVTKNIPDNGSYTGNFAIEHKKFLKFIKKINKEEF